MKWEERRRSALHFVRVAQWAGVLVVLATSSRAAGFPSFKDACPTNQIERPCTTQEGVSGTCIAAECRQTVDPQTDPLVDANATIACTPCAICDPSGPFQRCTDTIACQPGFSCFNYGVEPLASIGPVANPIQFSVWGSVAACLEAGAGPVFTSEWAPCGDGARPVDVPFDAGSGVAIGLGSGEGLGGDEAVDDAGAASLAPTSVATSIDASVSDNGGASAPTHRDADPDLSRGGCEIGAGAATNAIPLMGVIFFWIARRRHRARRP